GHLDGVIVLEAEKKLVASIGNRSQEADGLRVPLEATANPLPAADDDATPANLKGLRKIYRDAFAKLDATRAANLKALTDPLSLRLKQLESTLTQKNRVPDAKTVREYREGLGRAAGPPAAATGPAAANPPNPALAGASALPRKKFPPGDDRKAAEWVLSVGGSVRLAGVTANITDAADLPRGRFEVTGVYLEFTATKRPLAPVDNLLPLAGLKGLTRLNLITLPITAEHLEILPSLPVLSGIQIVQTGVKDEMFRHLAGSSLQFLDIGNEPQITGEGIEVLAAAKSLQILTLNNFRPTEEGLRQIGKLKTLMNLVLSGSDSRLRDEHLPLLAGLDNLRSLSVRRTALTADGLAMQKQWSNLPILGFDLTPGQSGTEAAVLAAAFPKLESISLEGAPTWNYTADDLRALKNFPRLKIILFVSSALADEAMTGVLDLEKLEGMHFRDCQKLTDAALETLSGHKKLSLVSLDILPKITDASLTSLTKLRSLKTLELKSCPNLTPAAIAAFEKARPDVTVVR
ncbi:MAG: hypothetical protein ACKVY0_08715, partial [Prosthecobacter sp.]